MNTRILTDEEIETFKQKYKEQIRMEEFSSGFECGVCLSIGLAIVIFVLFHIHWSW